MVDHEPTSTNEIGPSNFCPNLWVYKSEIREILEYSRIRERLEDKRATRRKRREEGKIFLFLNL